MLIFLPLFYSVIKKYGEIFLIIIVHIIYFGAYLFSSYVECYISLGKNLNRLELKNNLIHHIWLPCIFFRFLIFSADSLTTEIHDLGAFVLLWCFISLGFLPADWAWVDWFILQLVPIHDEFKKLLSPELVFWSLALDLYIGYDVVPLLSFKFSCVICDNSMVCELG